MARQPAGPFICGLAAALAVIGGKWKPLILYYVIQKTRRYGELRRCLGTVSDKVLIQQLKELEADGAIERVDHHEIPPRVDYSLTPFGLSLAKALAPLCEVGEAHAEEIAGRIQGREAVSEAKTGA